MIPNSVAYFTDNGHMVPRKQRYRNRRDKLYISDIIIDDDGGIDHLPISNLSCFASPIEYLRGQIDTRPSFKGVLGPPRGCAGCPSRIACHEIAERRIASDAELESKRTRWEAITKHLAGTARFAHRTFTEFALACEQRRWESTNETLLEELRAEKKRSARKARATKQKKAKRQKSVGSAALIPLGPERVAREAALMNAARSPRAPTWLRNLPDSSIELVCDVWQVVTAIEDAHRGEVTGGDIARTMISLGLHHGKSERVLITRVNEALHRISRLEMEPSESPVWEAFVAPQYACPPRSQSQISHGVVLHVIDDADP